uniref:Secreted protein n=1 Tax=Ascaris lumbricoides TaxID=6252 RepID=A0A0M3HS25_ASCLU
MISTSQSVVLIDSVLFISNRSVSPSITLRSTTNVFVRSRSSSVACLRQPKAEPDRRAAGSETANCLTIATKPTTQRHALNHSTR